MIRINISILKSRTIDCFEASRRSQRTLNWTRGASRRFVVCNFYSFFSRRDGSLARRVAVILFYGA